jgi:serine/threonine protein kinase
MTYEMLVGTSPFEADIIEITKKGKAPELSQLTFPESCQLSHDAREFLEQLLNTDPQERLGIDEALRHEFIQKYLKN